MALIEVGLLSGFSLSPNFVSVDEPIKKVENEDGKVHLYLDSVSPIYKETILVNENSQNLSAYSHN